MTIIAKYASTCPACSKRIQPGTKVEWSKGSPARHVDCRTAPIGKIAITGGPAIAQRGGRDSYGNRIGTGASYRAGVTAPGRRRCPNCGSRECSRAWDPRDLCDED
jgi:RNA polymerase subunit RPABC4/transcription elongation factor Spt4